MKHARKALVALGTACGVAAPLLADGHVSGSDGIAIGLAFLGALGVYQAPNMPKEG